MTVAVLSKHACPPAKMANEVSVNVVCGDETTKLIDKNAVTQKFCCTLLCAPLPFSLLFILVFLLLFWGLTLLPFLLFLFTKNIVKNLRFAVLSET